MSKHVNKDGTINGVTLFSELSGLSQSEIRWMFERMKYLLHVEKRSKDEAKAIVKQEAKSRPWENGSGTGIRTPII